MDAEAQSRIGKFRVLRTLGQGAMGRVFLAQDPLIDRRVAIKVMAIEGDAESRERFRNEARTVGQLSHPNIVQVFEFGFHRDQPYLVMEYLEGESLDRWLERGPPFDGRVAVLLDLCRAVEHAHSRGVLHRDVKPSNVQVLPDGTSKLMDFGIARSQAVGLTATGTVLGTPEYLAPEILLDARYSTASDLYAVALVAYRTLAGFNPFHASSLEACITRVLAAEPEPLGEVLPQLDPRLAEVVDAYLRKDPSARPAGVAPLKKALKRALGGSSTDLSASFRRSLVRSDAPGTSPPEADVTLGSGPTVRRPPSLAEAYTVQSSRLGRTPPPGRRRPRALLLAPAAAVAALLGLVAWRGLPPWSAKTSPAAGEEASPAAGEEA
ncbi:MAG: serine/threonine protein kinase, partial [Acidobacteria bacterium]